MRCTVIGEAPGSVLECRESIKNIISRVLLILENLNTILDCNADQTIDVFQRFRHSSYSVIYVTLVILEILEELAYGRRKRI